MLLCRSLGCWHLRSDKEARVDARAGVLRAIDRAVVAPND